MDISKSQHTTYTLTLSLQEARLLKNIMQNPLWGETPDEEDAEIAKLRKAVFDGLKNQLRDP